MKLDLLESLKDDELQAVIARAGELLREYDRQRKEKAIKEADEKMHEARAILLCAGLTPEDLPGRKKSFMRSRRKSARKLSSYQSGHRYQHPTKKELMWDAKGQKPAWLRHLEAEGGRAIEVPIAAVA